MTEQSPQRNGQAGAVSPLLVIVLLVVVAVFIFTALAGSRGGLSGSGCLPQDTEGRQRLFQRWFKAKPLTTRELALQGCAVSGTILLFQTTCAINIPGIKKVPGSWFQRIRALFRNDRRSLAVKATLPLSIVALELHPNDGSNVITGKLKAKRTEFTFSREGARLLLTCLSVKPCQLDLSPPAEEP
jgi:hypothetical protein